MKFIVTNLNFMVNIKMVKKMELELINLKMVLIMKVNLKIINLMVMEFIILMI